MLNEDIGVDLLLSLTNYFFQGILLDFSHSQIFLHEILAWRRVRW